MNLRLRTSVWAVASSLALAAWPLASEAAGLGKINVFSALGQPLRAELEVFATREELSGMKAQLASPDAFRQAGVEYTPTLSGITLSIDKRPNGQPIIRLSSARPINDPFVDMLLELNWPTGRLLREYTFLLDPPEFSAKAAAAAGPSISRPVATAQQPVEARPPTDRPVRAPKPRASEQPAMPSDGGGTHEVKRGETLSSIAAELRPEGVSLDQMLLGLFRANPSAFDRGNINRLKAGKILSVPDKAALEAIPRGEARTLIVAQSADWGAYRRKLASVAGDAPSKDEGARQQAVGKITTRVEDRAGSAAEPKDQLKVSKPELPGAKQVPAPGRVDEELIAKEKALKDANERLASLERSVAELQRLVELKSQSLADLERQSAGKSASALDVKKPLDEARTTAAASGAQPASGPALATAPSPSGVVPVPPVASTSPDKSAGPAAEVKPADTVGQAVPPVEAKTEPKAEVPKPVEAPKPAAVVPPAPPEEPGFFEELLGSPAALAGGGAIAALLAAYAFVKRRRESTGETPLAETSTLAPAIDSIEPKSVFRSTGGQSVDTSNSLGQTDFSQAGPGSIDTDEVDPVAEADVYMAYGRDAQAEEILLEAKQKDPRRFAIHLKLLEIYLSRKDVKPFDLLATELFKGTGGFGPEWEKAVALGRQLDSRNPLFASGQQSAPESRGPQEPIIETSGAPREAFTKPGQPSPGQLSQVTAAGLAEPVRAGLASETQAAAKPEAVDLADLDFDLGTRDAQPGKTGDGSLETTLALPNAAQGGALDFDLATSLPEAMAPSPDSAASGVRLVEDASSLEETMLVAPETQISNARADAGLDFEFDLAPEAQSETTWGAETLTRGEATEVLDVGSAAAQALEFDVRLSESTVLGDAMQHPAFDMSSISLDLAETDRQSVPPLPTIGGPADFTSEEEQEDTLVNPNFSIDQTDTEVNAQFGAATELVTQTEISSSEEVATKLDLAKAYQEMGDLEGARELLQEVVNEGDAAQREAAQTLLSELRE
jgi:pilus assembly protein FimV